MDYPLHISTHEFSLRIANEMDQILTFSSSANTSFVLYERLKELLQALMERFI